MAVVLLIRGVPGVSGNEYVFPRCVNNPETQVPRFGFGGLEVRKCFPIYPVQETTMIRFQNRLNSVRRES